MMQHFQRIKNWCLSEIFRSLMLCLIAFLLFFNFYDRRRGINEINGNLREFQMSRLMLNSRAQIQIILCNAALEGRPLKAIEIDTIKRLWQSAEYDKAYDSEEKEEK